jgi:bifunctional non-homologous end joining protein LigD
MLFTPIKPMLLSNFKATPFSLSDPSLLYEIKYDGWRLLLHKEGSRVEIYTRHGNIVTNRFPEFVEAAADIKAHSVILDCEGVCIHPDTLRPDFEMFSVRAKLTNPMKIIMAMQHYPATLITFDVIMIDNHFFNMEKLLQRKNRLADIVPNNPSLMRSAFVVGNGQGLYDWTLENRWEGICAKHVSSKYRLNSRPDSLHDAWVKRKHTEVTEAYIMGYRSSPFALLVGLKQGNNTLPTPVAIVDIGFSSEEKVAFRWIAKQIHTTMHKGIQMVEPVLSCKVEYLERTSNGALRTCTFRGFVD